MILDVDSHAANDCIYIGHIHHRDSRSNCRVLWGFNLNNGLYNWLWLLICCRICLIRHTSSSARAKIREVLQSSDATGCSSISHLKLLSN